MLRRSSQSEAVLSVIGESGHELSYLSEEDKNSSISSSFRFLGFKSGVLQHMDEFAQTAEKETRVSEEEEEAIRRLQFRLLEARGQRGHVHKNAKIILMDDDKFRQFKQAIKQTGMLTASGVKQVLLSPTIDERRRSPTTAKSP